MFYCVRIVNSAMSRNLQCRHLYAPDHAGHESKADSYFIKFHILFFKTLSDTSIVIIYLSKSIRCKSMKEKPDYLTHFQQIPLMHKNVTAR